MAVLAIAEVMAKSQVCGWAAGGAQVARGGSVVTRLWPTLDQTVAHSGHSLRHIKGAATIFARPALGPRLEHD